MIKLIGILLPAFIDLINRKVADSDARFWIATGICVGVGAGVNYVQTLFVFPSLILAADSISESILATFGLAQLSYKLLWENSAIRERLGLDVTRPYKLNDA